MSKASEKAELVAARKRQAWFDRMRAQIGHVFKRIDYIAAQKAYDDGISSDEYAAKLASMEPVGQALHGQKVEAMKAAEKQANETVERVRKELETAGWDIYAAAPYPDSMRDSRPHYMVKLAKYKLFHSVTTQSKDERNRLRRYNQPEYVEMSDEMIGRFVIDAMKDAAFEYDKFICKMVVKVGPFVMRALITGNHIWSHSILTVTKASSIERWKTQQIWNVSKLGKDFPQWPSRLLKD